MVRKRSVVWLALALLLVAAAAMRARVMAQAADDPVVARIIEIGKADNQVMKWNDYASNRFGGRETGTNAYTDATE